MPRNLNESVHSTRGSNNRAFVLFKCKTECFRKSFFPSATLSFNNLSPQERNCNSVKQFKHSMYKSLKKHVPCHFLHGARKFNITLAQMRLEFCNLNYDLFRKGCTESAVCQCGNSRETLDHYFCVCNLHAVQRTVMLEDINVIVLNRCNVNSNLLISGNADLDVLSNIAITDCVIKFLNDTRRF